MPQTVHVKGQPKPFIFPDGMSRAEMAAAIQARLSREQVSATQTPPQQPPGMPMESGGHFRGPVGDRGGRTMVEGMIQGMVDPFIGASRVLDTGLAGAAPSPMFVPESAQGLPLRTSDSNPVDPIAEARERAIQESRGGAAGMPDPSRFIGNMLSPANVAPAKVGAAIAGGGLLRNTLGGMAGGATGGLMAPTGDPLVNLAVGGATGGALGGGTHAVGRLVSPRVNPDVRILTEHGITPTPGRHFGKAGGKVEDIAVGSAPGPNLLLGARAGESAEQFNRAIYNEVLKPLGMKADPKWEIGVDAVSNIHKIINNAYESAFDGVQGIMDDTLKVNLLSIGVRARRELSGSASETVERIIKNRIITQLPDDQVIEGRRLQAVPRDLRDIIAKLEKGTWEDGEVAKFLGEAKDAISAMLKRKNDSSDLAALNRVDAAYPRFKALSRANPAGEHGQGFSPAQMDTALRVTDKSKDKMRYHEGGMPMQRLTQAARAVLPAQAPDSGTPIRMATNTLTGAGGVGAAGYGAAVAPETTAAILGMMSIPYIPGVPKGFSYAMTQRPEWADPLARGFNVMGLMAAPGAGGGVAREW